METADQRRFREPGTGDRLSSLPDETLCHILFFLHSKQVVATAVLSRRWKDLWTIASGLDLDNSLVSVGARRDSHRRFVDRVLSQHRNLNSLKRFRFHFSAELHTYEVRPNFWLGMEFASDESQLEEIDVKLVGQNDCMRRLPESFYSLKRLKVLKLDGVLIEPSAKGSVLLPSMKILQLLGVEIKACEALNSLISGCPALENLLLEKCYCPYRNERDIVIASLPCLKNLRIVGSRCYDNVLCPIEIEAPGLEHLYLGNFAELQFMGTCSPLPCLRSARVDVGCSQIAQDELLKFLAQISYAKEVALSWETLSLLNVSDDVQLPIFSNLTHLTIGNPGSSCILHSLLDAASKLQSLVIDLEDGRAAMVWDDESEELARTPECLLSSLEEIKFENLEVDEDDMKMVAYLLEAGAVLKKVNIHLAYDAHGINMQYQVYLKGDHHLFGSLLKLSRASRACDTRLFLLNGNELYVYSDDDETDGDDDFEGMDEEDDTDDDTNGTNDDDDMGDESDGKDNVDEIDANDGLQEGVFED